MEVKLKASTPNMETNIVEIARVSSTRTDKSEKPEGLINYLINNRHWSPFEHGFITMEITTSKAIGIQLLRHRSFTFQEFSQCYAKVTNLEPISLRLQAEKNRQSSTSEVGIVNDEGFMNYTSPKDKNVEVILADVSRHLHQTQVLYDRMLESGIAKECARMILPMTTETTIYMTGNVRSWIHLMSVRDDSHAQLEAQLIAKEMKKIFIQECPIISKALNY